MAPTVEYEKALQAQGQQRVAGLDEAGRGCWAGPVVAAAVMLAPQVLAFPTLLAGVDDSKVLSAKQREVGYRRIKTQAQGIGIGVVPAYIIDGLGILPATRLAMIIALLSLPCSPSALLIDAVTLPLLLPQTVLIKGDARSLSIAAASVVAKVTRDRLMREADLVYPAYSFGLHKGYGTAAHRKALAKLGPCLLHRLSFRPLRDMEPLNGR